MRVVGFRGSSGTGKSHRALWVSRENGLDYIIDDGLLIFGNIVVAGKSAKKAPSKIASIRTALFQDEDHREEVKKAIRERKPGGILILGTSDKMISRIAEVLELGEIQEWITIEDVATPLKLSRRETPG